MTCSFFDVGCHLTDWFGWLLIPTWWHVIAGLIVGSVLGARFGWLAPISLGLSVLVPVLLGRRSEREPDNPDFQTTRRQRVTSPRKPDTRSVEDKVRGL